MDIDIAMDMDEGDVKDLSTFLQDLPPLEEKDGACTSSAVASSSTPRDCLEITQIICFFNVGVKLSLEVLYKKLQNVRYRGTQDPFDHLFYEIKDPQVTFIIHTSGKVRLFGSKNMSLAKVAALRLVRTLRKMLDYKRACFENFKVENIVAGKAWEDFFPVKLDKLKIILQEDKELRKFGFSSFYEPGDAHAFNGLKQVLTINGQKVVVNVFSSGAVRVVGATTIPQLHEAFDMVHPHVIRARVQSSAAPKPERVI